MRALSINPLRRILGLAAAIALTGTVVANAQQATQSITTTISNTATILWDAGVSRVGRNSNRVDVAVTRPVGPPAPASLSLFQFEPSQSQASQPLTVPTTMCQAGDGTMQTVDLTGVFAGISVSPASVRPASSVKAGSPLIIAIDSPSDNRDSSAIESLNFTLDTPDGDSEVLVLTESSADSGRFIGMIRTSASPPIPVQHDCVLTVHPGDSIDLEGSRTNDGTPLAAAPVDVLIDPFGVIFDSGDGSPVSGTRISLVNAVTGQPADVFGDDGVSAFPSTIISGSTVTDAGGQIYPFGPGDYRFPFTRAGTYRLVFQPPQPFSGPSTASPAELAGLLRPDGQPFRIIDGSYSRPFVLNDPAPVRIDIPVDQPGGGLSLTKTASQQLVAPGDALQYRIAVRGNNSARSTGAITVSDTLPEQMRLRKDSVRYNGEKIAHSVSNDGRTLTAPLPPLARGGSGILTYLLEVRPDANPGTALNRAVATDSRGAVSAVADSAVRIARDAISERMTIIGRITDGGCQTPIEARKPVAGVRVLLEDGSYSVTDIEGRYHFEGVFPGLHVVQIDPSSLPVGQIPADCAQNARSAGSAISRFVEGQGGTLARADFHTQSGENTARLSVATASRPVAPTDQEAAGTDIDWFADESSEIEWLFPAANHNPRSKAVRVAIKHAGLQSVKLFANGEPVSPLSFEGKKKNGDGRMAVSLWRALPLDKRDTIFTAEIYDEQDVLVKKIERTVHFSASPLRAELLPEKSILVADGVTRPVIAIRMLDRDGRPSHHGIVGDFEVPAPYFPAVEADAQAAKQLSGLERAKPVWRIDGDDGIAYIELEPTTASGGLTITLPFRDVDVTRRQQIQTWLTPGKRPWTMVGFAAGTAGFNTLNGRLEKLGADGENWYTDARIALYAKGRVKGQWLLTLAYDSDKPKDETRFGGTIDPTAYYTIYADRSERRFEAASVRKLYVKLERPQFYALFGDYETGINTTQLTRYNRSFNGVKAEFRNNNVSATAFAADTPFRHRRQEIQGNGLSGPYALAARDILANSERVVIESRDRLRSDKIIESRTLTRHIDYDIDYVAGTLQFREPILSRTSQLDPQFIIVDYEVDGVAQRATNAGGRITWTNDARTLVVGATSLHDEDDTAKTNVGGVDVRYIPSPNTEVRAEFAASNADAKAGALAKNSNTTTAWLIEAEHHGTKYDLLAYAREQQAGYGVGQTNGAENGSRKYGLDGRLKVAQSLSLTGSAWQEDYLASDARRQAGRLLAEYQTKALSLRTGVTIANDRLTNGDTANSTIAQFGATKRLLNNRLELDAQTEVPLGQSESIDFPARHRATARLAVTDAVNLVGSYEIASGKSIDARTARVGFDIKPWQGASLIASANQQNIAENGSRTFAAYGLAQSLPINDHLTVDLTLDGNKTLKAVDRNRVLNPLQPIASGGFLGSDGSLAEDFTAITAGATWRSTFWSFAGRGEVRDGATTNRYGLTLSGLRQIGQGRAFGGAFSWFRATDNRGIETQAISAALSLAHRPDNSRVAILNKLELRSDRVTGAQLGQTGPIGGAALTISGNASSKRVINSFAINWSPTGKHQGQELDRSEFSLFWGARYVFDKIGQDQLKGLSNVIGADIRFDLSKRFDLGIKGTARINPNGSSVSYSGGPAIGISPFENGYISVGYNVVGFHDRDFQEARYTNSGPFVTLRLKFDQNSLAALGLGRR